MWNLWPFVIFHDSLFGGGLSFQGLSFRDTPLGRVKVTLRIMVDNSGQKQMLCISQHHSRQTITLLMAKWLLRTL